MNKQAKPLSAITLLIYLKKASSLLTSYKTSK